MAAEQGADLNDMVPFNFSRAGTVAQDQLRTLSTLNEQFARNLTHSLGAWLRTTITVTPLPPEQAIYSQFAESTAGGCYVLPLKIEPLQSRAAFSCDLALAPAIIDLLLGGSGRASAMDRELTEIEEAVLGSVLDIVLREWTTVWQPFGMGFLEGPRERGGPAQRPMPLQERTLCCRLQVMLAETTGEILFCMPSASITAALRAVSQRRERQPNRSPEERVRMARRLGGTHVHASMHFPTMQMRAEGLRSMTPGSLLPLPLAPGTTAEVCVGGTVLFRAQPVVAGGHRAAQIDRLIGDDATGWDTR